MLDTALSLSTDAMASLALGAAVAALCLGAVAIGALPLILRGLRARLDSLAEAQAEIAAAHAEGLQRIANLVASGKARRISAEAGERRREAANRRKTDNKPKDVFEEPVYQPLRKTIH